MKRKKRGIKRPSMNKRHQWTVCDELVRQGYMSKEERKLERIFCRSVVPLVFRALYVLCIWPVCLIMRYVPFTVPLVNLIARTVWIDRAVFQGILIRTELRK